MKKYKLSAAVAAYNEEENIVDLIDSLKKVAGEIVIVDGSSKDKTAHLAKLNGAKVISTTNKLMFQINKNLAIDHCSGDWIIMMDADERISDELAREIKTVLQSNPSESGFQINRRNWFLGGYLKKGGAYPDSVIRLFKRGKGKLPAKDVHEQLVIKGEVGQLKSDILHLADPDFERYLKRAVRYTDQSANWLRQKKPGRGAVQVINYMLAKPLITFFKIYIRHKGYQDGFRGFIWALFSSAHHFYAYVKYWHQPDSKN